MKEPESTYEPPAVEELDTGQGPQETTPGIGSIE